MEAFLLFVLILALIGVAIRLGQLSSRISQLEDQQRRLPAPPIQQQTATQSPRPIAVVPAPPPAATHAPTPEAIPFRPAYIPPPPPIATPVETQPRPVPAIPLPPPPPREPKPHVSLEARLGQNWLNKLGITALVIGLALGLGKLIVNIGPGGKDAIGFALALGILVLGIFLERQPTYRLFARVLIGGGWALLFFLSFAIYHVDLLQVLHSPIRGQLLDLILMLLVATAMVVHSLRYHSQVVTTFAFLLAFLTVGLSNITLFSLVAGALLTCALAFIVYRERWYALGLAGLIGAYLNHFLWLHRVLPNGGISYLQKNGHPFPDFLPSAILLLSYWLIFRLLYVLRPPLESATYDVEVSLATLTALLNSAGLLGLLKYQSSHPEWAFYGLIAIGIAELTLSLIARGGLKPDTNKQPNRIAFITLSTLASVFLLAAIPFRFHGSSWTLFWLLEAEAFYLTGIRLPEIVFRRLGLIANFLTAVYLTLASAIALSTATIPAALPHNVVILFAAALVLWLNALWFNAEFTTRLWPSTTQHQADHTALRASAYFAPLLSAFALTFLLHPTSAWLGISWLLLSLALAFIADRIHSRDLATQADLLALAAILRTVLVNLFLHTEQTHGISTRLLTIALTAALLYLALFRKTRSYLLPAAAIAPTYTWLAGALVALLCWYQLEPISVAVAWGIFGLILFELGILFKKDYLRHQSYALLAAAFIRIFFANMQVPGTHGAFSQTITLSPSLYTVIPLIAAFAYIYERIHSLHSLPTDVSSRPERSEVERPAVGTNLDRIAGSVFSWCGLIAACTLLYFELRPGWIILAWTALAIVLLALACALKRTIFIAQSLVVVLAVAARGIAYHLFSPTPLATTFTTSRTFTIGLTSALLLLALPLAFYLRTYYQQNSSSRPEALSSSKGRSGETPAFGTGEDVSSRPEAEQSAAALERPASGTTSTLNQVLHHPEQPCFFAPLTLLTLLVYVELSGARITIGWVALGLAAFLFALAVKERSYRLSGLTLLLLSVAKVVLWDVWHLASAERDFALIILGASLLLVSFLYSRYRETLLKLL